MKYLMILSSIAALGTNSAFAEAHTATTAADWSGGYVGLSYDTLSGEMEYNDINAVYDYVAEGSIGAFGGYNWQNGDLVYGAELAIMTAAPVIDGFPDENLADLIEVRGRGGYVIADALLYGFLGLATAGYENSGSEVWDLMGISYGVGANYGIADNIFAGLEVSRRELEGDTTNAGQSQTSAVNAISLRVGYKF